MRCLIFLYSTNPELIKPYRDVLSKVIENDVSQPSKYNLSESLVADMREFIVKLFQ